jgi:Family of unknown function (DUF6188)
MSGCRAAQRDHQRMPWEGCEIRELPDGGRVFELAEPMLSYIRIDHQTRLQFGEAELVIECPFSLRAADATHELDPEQRAALGPLLALYPDTMASLVMSPDGTLTATFESGRSVVVRPDRRYEAWNIGGFWCRPGGFEP